MRLQRDVVTETIHYDSGGFNIDAFVAKPAGGGKHPAVLVIHDNQGLNDSIRDIAKQFAADGFFAFAPDFTSRLGGTRTPDQMADAVARLSPNLSVEDARAAFAYLQKDSEVDATKISAVGFGWGGWRSFMLAISVPELYRAVIYCGSTPSAELRRGTCADSCAVCPVRFPHNGQRAPDGKDHDRGWKKIHLLCLPAGQSRILCSGDAIQRRCRQARLDEDTGFSAEVG